MSTPAIRPATSPAPEHAGGSINDEQREAVRAAVTEALGNAYDCLRVWCAWGVGTMGPDDFVLVAEDDDRVAEIADAAIEAMRPTAPPASEAGEVGEIADHILAELHGFNPRHRVLGELTVERLTRAATLLKQQQHLLGLACQELDNFMEQQQSAPVPEVVPVSERLPGEVGDAIAHQAYVAFVQICKGRSDDAGTYDDDEALVRRALRRLDKLESDCAASVVVPWKTDGPAVPEGREPASVAAEARPLSPAAQAIWDAWNDAYEAQGPLEDMDQPIAAALRAAVNQVVPEPPDCGPASHDYNKGAEDRQRLIRSWLLALAAELEAQP